MSAIKPRYAQGNKTVLCGEFQVPKSAFKDFQNKRSGHVLIDRVRKNWSKRGDVITITNVNGHGNSLLIDVSDSELMDSIIG